MKGKNHMIFEFARDHLRSQRRRGGGLLVETGFPTSLVDLIVKNRERFKKSSGMEKNGNDSLILESPFPLPLQSPSSPTLLNNMVEERNDTVAVEAAAKCKECGNYKGLLMALMRVFFVVVLALGAKKFAVGLTMSAFILIFLEYVGKCLYGLIACSEFKKGLRLMVSKVLRFMRFREEKLERKNVGFKEEIKNHCLSNSICEIQVLQSKSSLVLDDESVCDPKLKLERSDSIAAFLDYADNHRYEVLEIKKKKSRRAKMKSKLNHIFARKSRREKKEEGMRGNSGHEEEQGNKRELECNSDWSSTSSVISEGKEAMDGVAIREVEEIKNKGNSGYLLLLLIALIGLFGGRIYALMLILSWCFLKKSSGELRRCCLILPVIRQFFPNV